MGTRSLKESTSRPKRFALYARVSTEEQTKGLYPSCQSQVEELQSYALSQGWQVVEAIRDEGFSAGSLKRPGLSRLRQMVQQEVIDGVICTWYDRFTRSRDFYLLDREFKTHSVDFMTLHDRTDRTTASGRFMEMMLVAAKTYEREQTGEKVRSKLRQRKEKGMWNGGLVSYGFTLDEQTQVIYPDVDKKELLEQLFTTYVETSSDHAVRDWLKSHRIPAPNGKPVWTTSTIRDLLCNRRYIAEIEINKSNQGMEGLAESERYRIVRAPHEPIISAELFELAQKIRREKAYQYPNHRKARSYGQSRPDHVFVMRGLLSCAHCDHPMSPHYVFHKAGYGRRQDSYICHYVCSMHKKYGTDCDHRNRVLAKNAESWVLEKIGDLVRSKQVLERAIERAHDNCGAALRPQQEALNRTVASLRANQEEIDKVVSTITSGRLNDAMVDLLNRKAHELKVERESLLVEQRRLSALLAPLHHTFDGTALRRQLTDFNGLVERSAPEQVQRLLRLTVRDVAWDNQGHHKMRFYALASDASLKQTLKQSISQNTGQHKSEGISQKPPSSDLENGDDWFDFNAWSDAAGRGRTDTPLREQDFESSASANSATAAISWSVTKD